MSFEDVLSVNAFLGNCFQKPYSHISPPFFEDPAVLGEFNTVELPILQVPWAHLSCKCTP